jgi:5-(aminomethyl)-3-furanmethanol phosphate kinase
VQTPRVAKVRVCVVKLGGALLSSRDLPARLRAWLATEAAARSDAHIVLIIGGGRLVDALREIDAVTPLEDATAHWLAIDLMDVAARIVEAALPDLFATSDFGELERRIACPGLTLFRPSRFLAAFEPNSPGLRLPPSWSVTSDSIAARLAIVLAAEELILIKSTSPPDDGSRLDLTALSDAGYVDAFLPRLDGALNALRFVALE